MDKNEIIYKIDKIKLTINTYLEATLIISNEMLQSGNKAGAAEKRIANIRF
jgi:hypothetical protein